MFEHLGIVYDSDGNAVNHRSIFKILVNPLLRAIGFTIGTNFEYDEKGKLTRIGLPGIMRHPRQRLKWDHYCLADGCTVKRKRIFI